MQNTATINKDSDEFLKSIMTDEWRRVENKWPTCKFNVTLKMLQFLKAL